VLVTKIGAGTGGEMGCVLTFREWSGARGIGWLIKSAPYDLVMRKKIFVVLLALVVLAGLPAAVGEERRALWDMSKLPVISADQTRALFGYDAIRSVNDDYSWQIPGPNSAFNSVLAPCSSVAQIDPNYTACIESVAFRSLGSEKWNVAKLSTSSLGLPTMTIVKKIVDLQVGPFPFEPLQFRPAGDKASVWSLPGAKHGGGDNYLVRASFYGILNGTNVSDGGLALTNKLELLPISFPTTSSTFTQDQMVVEEFPKNYEYKVRLKLGVFVKSVSGWFFGRLNNPVINRSGPEGFLEVIGEPARIPIGLTNVIESANAKQYFDPKWCAEFETRCLFSEKLYEKAVTYSPIQSDSPEILSRWEGVPGGVKTVATISTWSLDSAFFTANLKSTGASLDCLNAIGGSKSARIFLGAVVSNATLFQTVPPSWDAKEKAFIFQVASPHLDETGKPNLGTYTLYIPSDQAKCRWGADASAARASVQIIDSSGAVQITTAVAKSENGMLRFNISGFGYSSPTIKIKMDRSIPASSSSVLSKKTITCTKGKVKKSITGVKPVCPKGYKRVSN